MMKQVKPKTFDEYLAGFEEDIQFRLSQIKEAILKKFPKTEESIRYGMPAYKLNGVHVYFSAYKKHIGMYPIYEGNSSGLDFSQYRGKNTKDALHFPHSKPLPLDLILKLVAYKFTSKQK